MNGQTERGTNKRPQRHNHDNTGSKIQKPEPNHEVRQENRDDVQEFRIGELAGISNKPHDLEGRRLNHRDIQDGVIAAILGVVRAAGVDMTYQDIFSVRTLKSPHGKDRTPEVYVQFHKDAVSGGRRSGGGLIQTAAKTSGINDAIANALVGTLIEAYEDIKAVPRSYRGTNLTEIKLSTECVAAVLCDVDFEDQFLIVTELPDQESSRYDNQSRQCGLVIRYSTEGRDTGFTKESVLSFVARERGKNRGYNNNNNQNRNNNQPF